MENRNCQNCKQDFTIDQDDFDFYAKINVPPPTFCPECRFVRRYNWRNERTLFKTKCTNCDKGILSAYSLDKPYPIFCRDCWLSDAWDPMDFGQEYDFNKPFFEQFNELFNKVPRLNLFQVNSPNSDYSNVAVDSKNTYLSYSIVESEDVYYSKNIDRSREIIDSLCLSDCEKCAYVVYGDKNYNVTYSVYAMSCVESSFLYDCTNCSNCFMSSNLRNKQYVFRNKQYAKEEYESMIKKINMSDYSNFQKLIREFEEMTKNAIHRFAFIIKSVDSTGDALANTKNAKFCFEAYELENTKYVSRVYQVKDSMDMNNCGLGTELCYEYVSGGRSMSRVFFSVASLTAISDCYYTGWCGSSSNLFGCFGLRNKKFCILNKQYTEEEYNALLPKIIEHMNNMPYLGKNNRVYRFGEFFPIEISPFAYNESTINEHIPLSENEINKKGYAYHESDLTKHNSTIKPGTDISTGIDITKEVIGCEHEKVCLHQCTSAFKVTNEEFQLYKKFNLPFPRLCPNCRHYKRLEYRKPWKLWHRSCMCEVGSHEHAGKCLNEFETSYSPDRHEKIYCEECYQKEVI